MGVVVVVALNDIFQLTLRGQFHEYGAELNVFHYLNIEVEKTVEEIANAFINGPLQTIADLFYSEQTFPRVDVQNLFNPADKAEVVTLVDGSRVGIAEQMPMHDAFTTTFTHMNPDVRPGRKRWFSPSEVDNNDGVITAGIIPELMLVGSDVRDGLFLGADPPNDSDCQYVIVKRIPYEEDGKTKYRLPENSGEAVYGVVQAPETSLFVTTQNSRKERYSA